MHQNQASGSHLNVTSQKFDVPGQKTEKVISETVPILDPVPKRGRKKYFLNTEVELRILNICEPQTIGARHDYLFAVAFLLLSVLLVTQNFHDSGRLAPVLPLAFVLHFYTKGGNRMDRVTLIRTEGHRLDMALKEPMKREEAMAYFSDQVSKILAKSPQPTFLDKLISSLIEHRERQQIQARRISPSGAV